LNDAEISAELQKMMGGIAGAGMLAQGMIAYDQFAGLALVELLRDLLARQHVEGIGDSIARAVATWTDRPAVKPEELAAASEQAPQLAAQAWAIADAMMEQRKRRFAAEVPG
jgi:hypothetical protein